MGGAWRRWACWSASSLVRAQGLGLGMGTGSANVCFQSVHLHLKKLGWVVGLASRAAAAAATSDAAGRPLLHNTWSPAQHALHHGPALHGHPGAHRSAPQAHDASMQRQRCPMLLSWGQSAPEVSSGGPAHRISTAAQMLRDRLGAVYARPWRCNTLAYFLCSSPTGRKSACIRPQALAARFFVPTLRNSPSFST